MIWQVSCVKVVLRMSAESREREARFSSPVCDWRRASIAGLVVGEWQRRP